MSDDLGQQLSAITQRYQKPLIDILLEMQETKARDLKSAEFIRRLECLHLPEPRSGIARSGGAYQEYTFRRQRIDGWDQRDYVALSYTWESPPHLKETRGKYWVESRDNGNVIPSQVRDSVFDRAKKYMRHRELKYMWIDRECIMQQDGREKETAVQAMDLVYQCSEHPIGLLYEPVIAEVEDLELLAGLMTETFVQFVQRGQGGKKYELAPGLPLETQYKILWLQENYRGGMSMKLLLPHTIAPTSYGVEYAELFEDVPGEIVLESTQFHGAATAFCLAFEPPAEATDLIAARELVLERAKRYRILLTQPGRFGPGRSRQSMTPSIIADVQKRGLKNPFDRLPIIANCCKYAVRLDGTELERKGHSVSLAILAAFLLNGEILHNGREREASDDGGSGGASITDFLSAEAFDRYLPPSSAHGLTYIKSCRFGHVELTNNGMQTQGQLWKLAGRRIYTSKFARAAEFPSDQDGRIQHGLGLLAEEVKLHGKLHRLINYHAERLRRPRSRESFAEESRYYAALDVVNAMRSGNKVLRLGVLWKSDPSAKSPYLGIFICDISDPDGQPEFVFTSTQERRYTDSDNGKQLPNDLDKHVSLVVDAELVEGQLPRLRTRRWIHSLCYDHRCPTIDVVFPWPRAIEQI